MVKVVLTSRSAVAVTWVAPSVITIASSVAVPPISVAAIVSLSAATYPDPPPLLASETVATPAASTTTSRVAVTLPVVLFPVEACVNVTLEYVPAVLSVSVVPVIEKAAAVPNVISPSTLVSLFVVKIAPFPFI